MRSVQTMDLPASTARIVNPFVRDLERAVGRRLAGQIQDLSVFVFGSRRLGTAFPDADFDLLVVMPDNLPAKVRNVLRDTLDDLSVAYLLDHGADLSIHVRAEAELAAARRLQTAFYRNTVLKGLRVWTYSAN